MKKLTPEQIHKIANRPLPSIRYIVSLSKGAGTHLPYNGSRDWDDYKNSSQNEIDTKVK